MRRRSAERRLPSYHLVQNGAERVDVASRVELVLARRLLGAHVLGSPKRKPRLSQPVTPRFLDRQRDPEVREHRLAFVEQNVLRLDISMDHAMSVGVVERARDLPRNRESFFQPKLLFAGELRPKRFPTHERQDVPDEAVVRAGLDQGEDVRMIELRADADLLEEALGAKHRCEIRPEDLECHLAIVLQVLGEIDRSHPARTEFALERIAVDKSESQSGEKIGHGGLGGSGHPHHRSQPSARQRAVRRGEHFCPPVPQHPAGPPTWVLESPANTQAKRSSTSSRAWS